MPRTPEIIETYVRTVNGRKYTVEVLAEAERPKNFYSGREYPRQRKRSPSTSVPERVVLDRMVPPPARTFGEDRDPTIIDGLSMEERAMLADLRAMMRANA